MSWCRWSSMDFRCDLYIYESDQGIEVHVAKRRHKIDLGTLPPHDEQRERMRAVLEALRTVEFEDIELPHAGESYTFDTTNEAADFCQELADLGFIMPPTLIDSLRSDNE